MRHNDAQPQPVAVEQIPGEVEPGSIAEIFDPYGNLEVITIIRIS